MVCFTVSRLPSARLPPCSTAALPHRTSLTHVNCRFTPCAPSSTGRREHSQQSRGSVQLLQAVLTAEAAELDVTKMEPLGDRVLVKPQEDNDTTTGGVILAASASKTMQDALIGEVLAVGADVKVGVAKGDTVVFSKYSSSDVPVPDGEVCFVAEKSILAKLS